MNEFLIPVVNCYLITLFFREGYIRFFGKDDLVE